MDPLAPGDQDYGPVVFLALLARLRFLDVEGTRKTLVCEAR